MSKPASPSSILGFGSPCVDMIFKVDDAFLENNKIRKGDGQSTSWEHFKSVIDNCQCCNHPSTITTGGSAANTLKGLAKLGNRAIFYGKLGNDATGEFLIKELSASGVTPSLTIANLPTSQIAVFVTPDHQRSFLSFAGANRLITEDSLMPGLFSGVNLVHIEGYMIDELGIAYVERVMDLAKRLGCAISIDMGCPRIARTYSAEIVRLISEYVTITFANHDEVSALLNLPPMEGCVQISKWCPIAVIGIGKDGCWVASDGDIFHSDAIKVDAIDTTGAGDLFACGFLHSYLSGASLRECAATGNLLGGTVVTHLGAEIPSGEWPALIEKISTLHALS